MFKATDNLAKIRHSLSHLLAAAVLKKYPDTKLGIGPTIENGFYYDFLFPEKFSANDLLKLEKEINKQLPPRPKNYSKINPSS